MREGRGERGVAIDKREDSHSSSSSGDEFFETQEFLHTDAHSTQSQTDALSTQSQTDAHASLIMGETGPSQPGSRPPPHTMNVTSSLHSSSVGSCDGLESPSARPRKVDLQPVEGGSDPLSMLGEEEDELMTGRKKAKKEKEEEMEWTCTERTGALKPYKDLVLIATGELMYEPVIQVSLLRKQGYCGY